MRRAGGFFFGFAIFIFSSLGFAAEAKKKSATVGVIVNDGAPVFQNANFDSPVMTYLSAGKKFEISSKKINEAFYRIRVKPGQLGYISDVDIQIVKGPAKKATEKKESAPRRPKRPFEFSRYGGFEWASINYRENTMGLRPTENLSFFGFKLFGPDMALEGDVVTDVNFLFHHGAPSYYETATGNAASGWIFITNFLVEAVFPQSSNVVTYFGFGPMLKISNFNIQLGSGATSTKHNMQDISLGAVFNYGVGLRWDQLSLRGEIQYYWERLQYTGFALSAQLQF